jgi:flagellar hook assembly protein FlgD
MKKIICLSGLILFSWLSLWSETSIKKLYCYPNPVKLSQKKCTIVLEIDTDENLLNEKWKVIIVDKRNQKVWSKEVKGLAQGRNTLKWGLTNDQGKQIARGLYYCKTYLHLAQTKYRLLKIVVK